MPLIRWRPERLPPSGPNVPHAQVVEWKLSARKEIRTLDPTVRRRVIEAVTALGAEPRPPGPVALTGSPGWRRIRIGGHRVIYDIRDDALVVLVLRVGSRASVYRRLDE